MVAAAEGGACVKDVCDVCARVCVVACARREWGWECSAWAVRSKTRAHARTPIEEQIDCRLVHLAAEVILRVILVGVAGVVGVAMMAMMAMMARVVTVASVVTEPIDENENHARHWFALSMLKMNNT